MSGTRSIAARAQAGPVDPVRPLGLAMLVIATAQLMVVLDSTTEKPRKQGRKHYPHPPCRFWAPGDRGDCSRGRTQIIQF
jgi:hypothetical protein